MVAVCAVVVLVFAIASPLTGHLAVASACSIEYENKVMTTDTMATLLNCGLNLPIKWWHSSGACGEFTEYSNCTSGQCSVPLSDSIGGNLYYCCTVSSATDVLSLTDAERDCFKMEVCTDVSMNVQGETTAFFNEPVQIFIRMISEPRPTQSITVLLTQSRNQELTDVTFDDGYRVGTGALWAWQYVVQVPDFDQDVDSGILKFSVNYEHNNSICRMLSSPHIRYQIPVRRRTGPSPYVPQECPCSTEPETQGPSVLSPGCERDSAVIGLAVTSSFLLLLCLFVAACFLLLVCVAVCRRRRFISSNGSPDDSSSNSYGMRQLFSRPTYDRVNSTASTTTNTPLTATTPLPSLDPNHPLSRVARGDFQNGAVTNEHHSPPDGDPTTQAVSAPPLPPPPYNNRTLPGVPVASGAQGGTPMSTIREEEERSAGPPVYERVNSNVPLTSESTDSNAVMV